MVAEFKQIIELVAADLQSADLDVATIVGIPCAISESVSVARENEIAWI